MYILKLYLSVITIIYIYIVYIQNKTIKLRISENTLLILCSHLFQHFLKPKDNN